MEYKNESQNNAHPPVSVSIDPPWIGFPNTNWGTSLGPSFAVKLDPQVNVRQDTPAREQHGTGVSLDSLADEFAEINDDLLRELAR